MPPIWGSVQSPLNVSFNVNLAATEKVKSLKIHLHQYFDGRSLDFFLQYVYPVGNSFGVLVHIKGKEIVETLVKHGHTAYYAGGYVRDMLMEHESDDIDIVTSASVEEVAKLFSKTVPVGVAFGIIVVILDGHPFEVAQFRSEGGYEDGRRPTHVEPADPQEDAKRRDFTINGMFYDPLQDEVLDYVGGKEDLAKKVIRAIGDPNERFREDRLRMIRAVRYAARFQFAIEEATKEAIRAHAHLLFPSVALERVWNEFQKMAKFPRFASALSMLHSLRLLQTIFPLLCSYTHEELQERIAPIRDCPNETPTALLLFHLFSDLTLEEKRSLCQYLKFSKQDTTHVESYHECAHIFQKEDIDPIEGVFLCARDDFKIYRDVYAASLAVQKRGAFIDRWERFVEEYAPWIEAVHTPFVSATDLMSNGFSPGPELGKMLKQAAGLAIEHKLTDPEKILAMLQNK